MRLFLKNSLERFYGKFSVALGSLRPVVVRPQNRAAVATLAVVAASLLQFFLANGNPNDCATADFCKGMAVSPLATTVVTAILRCPNCEKTTNLVQVVQSFFQEGKTQHRLARGQEGWPFSHLWKELLPALNLGRAYIPPLFGTKPFQQGNFAQPQPSQAF